MNWGRMRLSLLNSLATDNGDGDDDKESSQWTTWAAVKPPLRYPKGAARCRSRCVMSPPSTSVPAASVASSSRTPSESAEPRPQWTSCVKNVSQSVSVNVRSDPSQAEHGSAGGFRQSAYSCGVVQQQTRW